MIRRRETYRHQHGGRLVWIVRGFISVLGMLALLVGFPVFLVRAVGWPLPRSWPTGDQWLAFVEQPVTRGFVVGLAACVGWLVWAALIAAVGFEVLLRVTGWDLPRLRLPAPLQTLAASMVGATVVTFAGGVARASAPVTTSTAAMAGQTAATPAAVVVRPASGTITFLVQDRRYHVLVRRHDTMSKIARLWLSDAGRWPEICRLNHHRHFGKVGGTLVDCDLIFPRWDLKLPVDAVPPPGAVDVSIHPKAPPAPSMPSPTASPSPSPAEVLSPSAMAVAERRGGVDLPGGWIVWPVAAGLLATTAVVLLRRRRPASAPQGIPVPVRAVRAARQTLLPPPSFDGDQDRLLLPPPPSLGTTRRPPRLSPTIAPVASADDVDLQQLADDANVVTTATVGETTDTTIGLSDLPASGVRLAGPGAAAAARGMLAAILVCGGVGRPQLAAQAITTADTLTDLGLTDPGIDRLTVTASLDEAIGYTEQQLAHRQPPADDGSDLEDLLADPPLLVLIRVADAGLMPRLTALAERGHAQQVYVVAYDHGAAGQIWSVDTAGHLTNGGPAARVNVLDAPSLQDICTTLVEPAAPQAEPPAPRGDQAPIAPVPQHRTPVSTGLRLQILGGPTVTDAAGNPVAIHRTGSLQIAVLLALHPQGRTREELLEDVFGSWKRAAASRSLGTCLWGLKRDLTTIAGTPLVNTGGRYRLDPDRIGVDWWQLLTHVDRGEHQQAIGLYHGPVAVDYDWDWLSPYRQHARQLVAGAHAGYAATLTEPQAMLDAALDGLAVNPFDEQLHRIAMRAHAGMGNPAGVRAQLAHLAERLATIDSEPSPETNRLVTHLTNTSRSQPSDATTTGAST